MSEGQVRLTRLTASLGVIAKRIGSTRQSVSEWRRGEKTPGEEARLKLNAAYGIDPRLWDVEPVEGDLEQPPPATPAAMETAIERADKTLADIQRHLRRPRLRVTEVVRLHEIEMKAIRLRDELETSRAMLDERIVLEHPTWHRIRALLVKIVRRLAPADAEELERAIEEIARPETQ